MAVICGCENEAYSKQMLPVVEEMKAKDAGKSAYTSGNNCVAVKMNPWCITNTIRAIERSNRPTDWLKEQRPRCYMAVKLFKATICKGCQSSTLNAVESTVNWRQRLADTLRETCTESYSARRKRRLMVYYMYMHRSELSAVQFSNW